jgi:hypothetical protein
VSADKKAFMEAARKSPALALSMALMQGIGKFPPKKPKRRPLLIDEVLANPYKGAPKEALKKINVVKARLRDAKVFVLDEAAAVYAAQMMRDHPEAIAKDIEFAIPPFQQMYIEFPFPRFYETVTSMDTHDDPLPLEDQDTDVGYFYDGPRVYVMSRTADPTQAGRGMLLPLRFRLNQPFTFQEEQQIATDLQGSRLSIDSFFWGSCYPKLMAKNDVASARALREHHSCEVWYGKDTLLEPKGLMTHLLRTNAGDMRSIVAFLLFLNRTRDVQVIDEIPPAPSFIHAKPRTLVRHNLIRIKLDPGPLLQRAFKGRATGGWRREHDVRGHWCADRNYHANPHDHDMRELHHQYWKCIICGGCKWWRKAHHRGRKDLGTVKTVYEVKK